MDSKEFQESLARFSVLKALDISHESTPTAIELRQPSDDELEMIGLEEQLQKLQEKLRHEEAKTEQMQRDRNELQVGVDEMKKKQLKLLSMKKHLLDRIEQLEMETKPSPTDALLLEKTIIKYKSFKRMTGIYWDYPALESDRVKGYVVNKVSKSTHPFELAPENSSSDRMWEEIAARSHAGWPHITNKHTKLGGSVKQAP